MKFNYKKIFFPVIMSLLLILGFTASPITANADTLINDQNKVQLYFDDIANVYHGATSNKIYLKVAKDIPNKNVFVEYKTASTEEGKWQIASANYYKNLDANYSIYAANASGFGDVIFRIKVISGSTTYVDDNNGQNYNNSIILGSANICALRNHGLFYDKTIQISAAVKNLAYNKNVKVRYTVNNWASYKEVPLRFVINNGNFELWSTDIDATGATIENFEYCLSYTVNGQTYWDNNFNDNYNLNHYCEY